jgi:hypothetical protein
MFAIAFAIAPTPQFSIIERVSILRKAGGSGCGVLVYKDIEQLRRCLRFRLLDWRTAAQEFVYGGGHLIAIVPRLLFICSGTPGGP